jgi:hypothetical protein
MVFKEIRWEVADWIRLAQDGTGGDICEHDHKNVGPIKCGELLDNLSVLFSFSRILCFMELVKQFPN